MTTIKLIFSFLLFVLSNSSIALHSGLNEAFKFSSVSKKYLGVENYIAKKNNKLVSDSALFDSLTIEKIIIAYPNPVRSKLVVKSFLGTLTLYNNYGKPMVTSTLLNSEIELDVSSYPKGIYHLCIITNNEFLTDKIIIE